MTSRTVRAKVASFACLLLASPAFSQPEQPTEDDDLAADETPVDAPAPEEPAEPPPAPEPEDMDEDEALSEEDAALLAESEASMTKPVEKGKGAIVGVVTDTKFNEPVIEGNVSVVGTKIRTLTDLEGRFRLELPPGTYTLRFSYELHRSTRVEGVVVKPGQIVHADAQLTPDESAVDVVDVVASVDRSSLEGQTIKRQKDAAVGDGVGRAEIARAPDRNAAEAARRVVGASIVGGRFVYVRGLGERYTNASLNGAPLPSPEPDRNTVPLDLFPSLIIDSINISKTFTPDMPADFAGGSVRIYTRQFPRETLFQVSLSGGYNTETTFRQGYDYPGSNTDWLGFDGGTRSLPDSVPDHKVSEGFDLPDGSQVTEEETERVGKELNSTMSTRDKTMPPNWGVSVVAGDAFKTGESQKLGAIASINYSRSYETYRDEIVRVYAPPVAGSSELRPVADSLANSTVDKVRWGAFASVAYEFSPQHTLTLTGLHSQLADDEAFELDGTYNASITGRGHATSLTYISRSLDVLQLRGEHDFPSLLGARLEWFGSLSHAGRDQPDTRSNVYAFNPDADPPVWNWTQGPQSGSHLFTEQGEDTKSAGLDWTQPFSKADTAPKVKLGGMLTTREREFDARPFAFERQTRLTPEQQQLLFCAGQEYPRNCPDKLFFWDNIGPVLQLDEKTAETDSYSAGLDVYAGYVMADMEVIDNVRVVAGPRIENTDLFIRTIDPYSATAEPIESRIEKTDVLPAAAVHFKATPKAGARFAASRTLARPQLREMAPFRFLPYFGGYPVRGNPDLEMTYITNLDSRFEFFPTLREVLAFSVFYKHFVAPIEEVLSLTTEGADQTYENAKGADMIGVELEARKTLEFLTPVLEDFALMANLTLVHSQVILDRVGVNTNAQRPLSNQSPFVFNLALDYAHQPTRTTARILYNVNGPRIATVGAEGMEDIYEQPRHLVDLTVAQGIGDHFELKGAVSNLLFAPIRFTQDGPDPDGSGPRKPKEYLTNRYQPGATFTLSAAYTH